MRIILYILLFSSIIYASDKPLVNQFEKRLLAIIQTHKDANLTEEKQKTALMQQYEQFKEALAPRLPITTQQIPPTNQLHIFMRIAQILQAQLTNTGDVWQETITALHKQAVTDLTEKLARTGTEPAKRDEAIGRWINQYTLYFFISKKLRHFFITHMLQLADAYKVAGQRSNAIHILNSTLKTINAYFTDNFPVDSHYITEIKNKIAMYMIEKELAQLIEKHSTIDLDDMITKNKLLTHYASLKDRLEKKVRLQKIPDERKEQYRHFITSIDILYAKLSDQMTERIEEKAKQLYQSLAPTLERLRTQADTDPAYAAAQLDAWQSQYGLYLFASTKLRNLFIHTMFVIAQAYQANDQQHAAQNVLTEATETIASFKPHFPVDELSEQAIINALQEIRSIDEPALLDALVTLVQNISLLQNTLLAR